MGVGAQPARKVGVEVSATAAPNFKPHLTGLDRPCTGLSTGRREVALRVVHEGRRGCRRPRGADGHGSGSHQGSSVMKRPCRMWFSLVLRRPGGAGLAPSGRQETDRGPGRCLVSGRVAGRRGEFGHQRAVTRQAYARVLAHLQGDVRASCPPATVTVRRASCVPGAHEAQGRAARDSVRGNQTRTVTTPLAEARSVRLATVTRGAVRSRVAFGPQGRALAAARGRRAAARDACPVVDPLVERGEDTRRRSRIDVARDVDRPHLERVRAVGQPVVVDRARAGGEGAVVEAGTGSARRLCWRRRSGARGCR